MEIVNSTLADISFIQDMYNWAIDYQKKNSLRSWLPFDPELIKKEIEEKRQWKIVDEGNIGCIFLTMYEDPFIWGERNNDPSVYIHRIVTHPDYHGRNYVLKIIEWAKEHARDNGKKFIRMDTWGDNPKLIDYYEKCGFRYLETLTPENTKDLPKHYSCISLALFEIPVEDDGHGQ